MNDAIYAVTGATGHLGRLAVEALIERVGGDRVIALARSPEKAADLAAKGVDVRLFDYDRPETLSPALKGVKRLLLVSSSEIGQRERQHGAVINAAKAAGVEFIAYTSCLHADTTPLKVAGEHRITEAQVRDSGLPFALLRNGWYNENYAGAAIPALASGALIAPSGDGRVSGAARADLAEAAAVVLTMKDGTGVYELAGDESFSMAELAAMISDITGTTVVYHDVPEDDYRAGLAQAGIPDAYATYMVDTGVKTGLNVLLDDSRTLSGLTGRPTTPIRRTLEEFLRAAPLS